MSEVKEQTIANDVSLVFNKQRQLLLKLKTESVKNRKNRLIQLREWVHKNRPAIHEAMYADFKKASTEVDALELFHVLNEIKVALKNLDAWSQPKKVDAPFTMIGTRSFIQYESRGLCLIIAPWNYPFSLAVGPLVSALAAGNSVILKPSELTPHVSSVIKRMAKEVFNEETVHVFEGGPEVAKQLSSLPFDHIFFTGSPAIGKVVMKAAAENLASVTLELGGKSPAIVTARANLREAAERIAVAKFVNNGQTCIAPDYVLADVTVAEKLIEELKHYTKKLFTEKTESFEESKSYCRIVNNKHFVRLNELLQDALTQGAKLAWGGKVDAVSRFIHPVILSHVPDHARILQEEIFGPILPVVTYKNLEEAIAFINNKPKPLGLYLFSNKKEIQKKILEETSAGGVCINDCAIHFLHHNLPFGGVNNSGMGKSHGYAGFLAFSHEKPVLKQKHGFTSVKALYPPYTKFSKRIMDWFLKFF